MKAAVFEAPERLRLVEMPPPEIGDHEVRVQVAAAGICVGDQHIFLGKSPYAVYPVVGGHEISGVVSAAGGAVSGVAVGDRVVVEPFMSCGKCYPCRNGKPNCCAALRIIGVHQHGGFAEFLRAPADRLHRIPAGLSLVHAALAEPVAIGVQACRRGAVRSGELAVVVGCGPIGLAIIEVATARGAQPVAIDMDENRLRLAHRLGAHTIKADGKTVDHVLELTNGEGAPVVLEATGNPKAMEQTIELVASGGRIVIVGLVKRGVGVTFPGLDFTRKEITLVGSRASAGCFPEALALLAAGSIRLSSSIQTLSLGDAPGIFRELAENPAALSKGVFVNSLS